MYYYVFTKLSFSPKDSEAGAAASQGKHSLSESQTEKPP